MADGKKRDVKPLGPYSLFREAGNFVFISGQIGLDENGKLPGDIKKETENALKNIFSILEDLGLSPSDIVKATIFTTRIDMFSEINEVWEKMFSEYGTLPARSSVGISALPKSALVEIEVIAYKKRE